MPVVADIAAGLASLLYRDREQAGRIHLPADLLCKAAILLLMKLCLLELLFLRCKS